MRWKVGKAGERIERDERPSQRKWIDITMQMSWASVGEHNLHKKMWSIRHNKETHERRLWYIWHKCLRFEHKNCSKVPDCDLPGPAPNWEVKSKLWVNRPTNNHVIKTMIFFSVALMLLTLNLLSCHSNQDDKKYKGSMFLVNATLLPVSCIQTGTYKGLILPYLV